MKKLLAIAAITVLTGMAGTAMAATGTLSVTAEVIDACVVQGGSLDFDQLDPTSGANVDKDSTGVTVTCTKDNGYTIGLNDGQHAEAGQAYLSDGTNTIAYSLNLPGGASGTGTGTAQTVIINGDIAASAYSDKPAGTYTDTVTITVTP